MKYGHGGMGIVDVDTLHGPRKVVLKVLHEFRGAK